MATVPEPQWLSRQEAARLLGVRVPVVDRLIGCGVLDRYLVHGRYVRVKGDQVRELVALPSDWLARC